MKRKGDTSPKTRPDFPDSGHPHPDGQLGRWVAGLTMAGLATAAFIISFSDGLFLVRLAGASGWLAYLYPLLPDGLIVISWVSMYEASSAGTRRTNWAIVGIVSGACLTVAMNLGAGALHGPLDALVDGVVPLVFFIALEILMGLVRRGRGAGGLPVAPATNGQQQTAPAPTTDEALSVLLATNSRRLLADDLGVTKARVETWAARLARPSEVPAGDAPELGPPDAAGTPDPTPLGVSRPPQSALNGNGAAHHEH